MPAGNLSHGVRVGGAGTGSGGLLASGTTERFTTGSFGTLALQQVLSKLGYLPLS